MSADETPDKRGLDALLEENKPPQPIMEAVNRYICVCGHEKSFDALIPVCKKCGLTDSHNIDDGPEWVGGVSEDGKASDPGRCGMASDIVLFSENWGRGTVINTKGASWAQKKMARINFHSSMNHARCRLPKQFESVRQGLHEQHRQLSY